MGAGHAHPAALTGAEGTRAGLRAIRLSAVALGASAALRLTIAAISGSVGLLAAGLDDLGDVLTTVVLSVAFVASRRAADNRYTYGYQRFEDFSGILVVLVIWGSAAFASVEAISKLGGEHEVERLGIALGAAALGLLANGFAGVYKIRVGRRIGSEPLVADGRHALTDGLASIAAVAGLLGVRAGAEWADPAAALVVCVAIAWVALSATRQVSTRLLDAVDPVLIARIEQVARAARGVESVGRVQARWAGRSLYVAMTVAVDGHRSVAEAHEVAEHLHHDVLHHIPGVAQVDVHVDPWEPHGEDVHHHTRVHADGVKGHSAAREHKGHGLEEHELEGPGPHDHRHKDHGHDDHGHEDH